MSASRGISSRPSLPSWQSDIPSPSPPSSPRASLVPPASVSPSLPTRRSHPARSSGDDYFPSLSGEIDDSDIKRHHSVDFASLDYEKDKQGWGKDKVKGKGDSDTEKEKEGGGGRSQSVPLGGVGGRSQALVSGMAYCVSSCSMILLNKVVLSSFRWEGQISLMFYQNLVSVCVVVLMSRTGFISTEPLTWRLARIWAPVNVLFVGMLITSFFSLQYMQVAMVMILKNITNLVTAVGEMYLFKKRHSLRVWGSIFLMIVSAFCGGITDLSFHPVGYTWQLLNCCFTAGYSLTLRRVMDKAKAATISGQLSEFSMVLLNNSLSLPLALSLLVVFGEFHYLQTTPLLHSPSFWAAATVSGLLGLAISFSSMWFLYETSPTTYSLVGSLNKIPLSVAGIMLFRAPTSLANLSSILFGCVAGVLFARAKRLESRRMEAGK